MKRVIFINRRYTKRGPFSWKMVYKKGNRLDLGAKPPREFVDRPPPPPRGGNARSPRDLLPGIALKESMGSRRHCSFQYPFQKPRDLILKSKLKIMKKNYRCQKCNYRLLFINLHSPNRHPVQNSKGWNGHHPKSAAHTPSRPNKPRVVSYWELLSGLGSRDNKFLIH